MMKIKFLQNKGSAYVGYVCDYDEATAKRLIKQGIAEKFDPKKDAKAEKPASKVKPEKKSTTK